MYELFEHTADLGLRVVADDLDELFADAGRGLFSMIVEELDEVLPVEEVRVHVEGDDRANLLVDWLTELLVIFETRRLVLSAFEVRVGETGLVAMARGEPLDRKRHRLLHEVKAITYHGLKVEPAGDGWRGEVIVDI